MRSGALAARPTDKEGEKGRVEATVVRRYRAGQAPAWAEQAAGAEAGPAPADGGTGARAAALAARELAAQVQRTAIAAPVVVKRADDPRLARLAARPVRGPEVVRRRERSPGGSSSSGGEEEGDEAGSDGEAAAAAAARRRRSRDAGPSGSGSGDDDGAGARRGAEEEASEEEEDEDALQRRREALRERLRLQQQQREAEAAAAAPPEEDEEEDSSEYTTDSEEEEDGGGPGGPRLIKPVFVPRGDRDTLAEREALEQEDAAAEEAEKARALQRKVESRQLVVEAIAAEEAALRAAAAGEAGPAGDADDLDTDDGDADAAFEEWKGREMRRIARDREERDKVEREARERERLRNMTAEERALHEAMSLKELKPPDKAKWRFMQKYWHKGAFFQEAPDDARGTTERDAIFDRDYSAPVGEDKGFDKSMLPKVMQVRNFGRTGRTKWTHLLDEDTSAKRREDEWYQARLQPDAKAGAVSGGFARTGSQVGGGGGGGYKRAYNPEEFSKPKKFKT